jgi:hypothetical protein
VALLTEMLDAGRDARGARLLATFGGTEENVEFPDPHALVIPLAHRATSACAGRPMGERDHRRTGGHRRLG